MNSKCLVISLLFVWDKNPILLFSVLAWQFGAEQMCRFTRHEFLHGCKALKADSCKGIQSKLPEVATQVVADTDMFKDLYRFTYKVKEKNFLERQNHKEYVI